MKTTRIHIQPCAAGYEYRLGASNTVHVARRDDVGTHLFDNVHTLYCMLTGRRPYDPGHEDHLIRRIEIITTYRAGPRPDRYAPDLRRAAGDGARVGEPVCTYLPDPSGETGWRVTYDIEPAQVSAVEVPPFRCRGGRTGVPVITTVHRPDGRVVPEDEWAPHVDGLYTAARHDMRRVEEPRLTVDTTRADRRMPA